jgi:hypothetical protein
LRETKGNNNDPTAAEFCGMCDYFGREKEKADHIGGSPGIYRSEMGVREGMSKSGAAR